MARFSEGRQSQCISSITELELRWRGHWKYLLKIISKVRAIFLYLRHYQNSQRAGSQKGCSMPLTVYSFPLGLLLTKQGIPADHQIATVLGNRQSQRGNPSTASGSHLHWVTPMEIPVKTFQPFLPEASPWDSASCRSKGGTGSNHTARVESEYLKLEGTHKNH